VRARIDDVRLDVVRLASLTLEAIRSGTEALVGGDLDHADRVVSDDERHRLPEVRAMTTSVASHDDCGERGAGMGGCPGPARSVRLSAGHALPAVKSQIPELQSEGDPNAALG
jgi:hypothetical protein